VIADTMKKILITGASGFLGYNLCCDLQSEYEIYTTQHSVDPVFKGKDSIALSLTGSLKPVEAFIEKNNIDTIIHCAAVSKPGPCSKNPEYAIEVNVSGTRSLAEVAFNKHCSFIFFSTDLLYNSGSGPHKEDEADPYLVYSKTKFDAELEAFMVNPATVVLRSALIFGNDDQVHGSFLRDNERDLLKKKPLTLFTNQYRTPIWSHDIAQAIILILQKNIKSRVYNIGGDTRINRYDLGMMFAEIFGWNDNLMIPVAMEAITENAPYLKDCSLDSSRIKDELGWEPTPLESAFREVAQKWV